MGDTIRAMVLDRPGGSLRLELRPAPRPGPGHLRLRVKSCGVCRTDLHVLDGELPNAKVPLVLGHQIVGEVIELGHDVVGFGVGQRVGVPWLGSTCGHCEFCRRGRENLCEAARFTGYQLDGGFAEQVVADHQYCFPLPDGYSDVQAAPLLCAGLIGYRALRMAGPARRIGLFGIGSAAHIVLQVAAHQQQEVYAFTRDGDSASQAFARKLGASWVGSSSQVPPEKLDAAILFAPVGALVPTALRALAPGGIVVCAGIHMSDIPAFPYELLWHERSIRSVANLTRCDAMDFLALARELPITTQVTPFPLESANEALAALRAGAYQGAGVLVC